MAKPGTTTASRFTLIDLYRGLALFGLLMVHMVERFGIWPQVEETHGLSGLVHLMFAGKAYATLALCFGINFSLLVASARRKGIDPLPDQIWRYGLLFLFGAANTMLFGGDVLQVIAVLAGILILIDRIQNNDRLLVVGLAFLVQPLIILTIFIGLFAPELTKSYLVPDATHLQPLQLATQNVYSHGGLGDVIGTNMTSGNLLKWWYQITSGRMFKSLGLFILGVYLGRTGFLLDPMSYLKAHRLPIIVILGLLPLTTITKSYFSDKRAEDLSAPLLMVKSLSSSYFSLFALLALLLLVTWLYCKFNNRLFRLIENAGRMTLTLYIMQSVVFVPLFYGFGLKAYTFITSGEAVVIGLGFFVLQVFFATYWLKRFEYGPLEWLWRKIIQARRLFFRDTAFSARHPKKTPEVRRP